MLKRQSGVTGISTIRLSSNLLSYACFALAVAAALFVRVFLPFECPVPWNDEADFIGQAYAFAQTGSFFAAGLNPDRIVMWMPPGFMVALAGAYKLFGYSFDLSRWLSCLFYLGGLATLFAILRRTLSGWKLALAALLLLIPAVSPYMLASANLARMESFYSLTALLSLYAALRGKPVLGLAIVLASAVIHFNAEYFLLPYLALMAWMIVRRQELVVAPVELLALALAGAILAGYGLFVLHHLSGFIEDMTVQFSRKVAGPAFGGTAGQAWVAASWAGALLLLILWRRFAPAVFLACYGAAYITFAFAGQEIWYDFARPLGAYLIAVAAILSFVELSGPIRRGAVAALGLLATAGMADQAFRYEEPASAAVWPRLSTLSRDFLPREELGRVRSFIAGLPPGTTVSFAHTGVEAFFFDDLERAHVQWVYLQHSVTGIFPFRQMDYVILCDSSLYPHFLFAFDMVLTQQSRQGRDTGCSIAKVPS